MCLVDYSVTSIRRQMTRSGEEPLENLEQESKVSSWCEFSRGRSDLRSNSLYPGYVCNEREP